MNKTHYSLVMFEAIKHRAGTTHDETDFYGSAWVGYHNDVPPHELINDGEDCRLLEDAISIGATPVGNGWNTGCSPIEDAVHAVGWDVFSDVPERWEEISKLVTDSFEQQGKDKPHLWMAHILTLWGYRGWMQWTDYGKEYDEEWWLCGVVTDEMIEGLAGQVKDFEAE
jgi:hypothetical protein